MAARPRLTIDEYKVIEDHITPLLDGAERALAKLPVRDTELSGDYVKNQRRYYHHMIATLDWVMAIAKQRKGGPHEPGRAPIRSLGADS